MTKRLQTFKLSLSQPPPPLPPSLSSVCCPQSPLGRHRWLPAALLRCCTRLQQCWRCEISRPGDWRCAAVAPGAPGTTCQNIDCWPARLLACPPALVPPMHARMSDLVLSFPQPDTICPMARPVSTSCCTPTATCSQQPAQHRQRSAQQLPIGGQLPVVGSCQLNYLRAGLTLCAGGQSARLRPNSRGRKPVCLHPYSMQCLAV